MRDRRLSGQRGVSLLELMIVVTIIGTVSAFAFVQINSAQQVMRRENATREFKSYLEKVRLDSIRRHATAVGQMASMSITNNNTYTVTMDFNYDGSIAVDNSGNPTELRTIPIPAQQGVQFNTGAVSLPMTTRFDWRGRPTTVDSVGNATNAAFTLQETSGSYSTTINLTGLGDASINIPLSVTTPTTSIVSAGSNIRSNTQVPY